MDYIASFIAAELIPGLVLKTAMRATKLHGGPRVTAALAAIGPKGMIGGLISLGVIQIASFLTTKGTTDAIYLSVVRQLSKDGLPAETILEHIDSYPVSPGLKQRLRNKVAKLQAEQKS